MPATSTSHHWTLLAATALTALSLSAFEAAANEMMSGPGPRKVTTSGPRTGSSTMPGTRGTSSTMPGQRMGGDGMRPGGRMPMATNNPGGMRPGGDGMRPGGGGMRAGGMRPGGGPRGPGIGGLIGLGIGAGVLIGTSAAAAAANSEPPPQQERAYVPRRTVQERQQPPQSRQPQQPPRQQARAPRPVISVPATGEQRYVQNEVVIEFAGNISQSPVAARHRLTRMESAYFPLSNTTYFRWQINDSRSVTTVLRQLANEGAIVSAQPNYYYYFVSDQQASPAQSAATQPASAPPEASQPGDRSSFTPPPSDDKPGVTPAVATAATRTGDPAQYAVTKLRLGEAHGIATGNNVLVAVIDSGIDYRHPELDGVVAELYDALGGEAKPHSHGTAIAGAIAARSRLMGVAPAARILAIRAFGPQGTSVSATTFAILKGLEHAVKRDARVINMSFAGPADPAMSRHLAAATAKGVVLVAASGNFGPKSPPQYPSADPNVIAVSATDAEDKLFTAANRGRHISVSAPGVDILLPAPDSDYQLTSGTSFAAAHVSGIVALILEHKPGLKPDDVRAVLQTTAKDLGPRGKDDQFGAGLVDAYSAVSATGASTAAAPLPGMPRPSAAR